MPCAPRATTSCRSRSSPGCRAIRRCRRCRHASLARMVSLPVFMTLSWLGHLLTDPVLRGDLSWRSAGLVPGRGRLVQPACRNAPRAAAAAGATTAADRAHSRPITKPRSSSARSAMSWRATIRIWRSSSSTTARPTTPRSWCASSTPTTRASSSSRSSQWRQGCGAKCRLCSRRAGTSSWRSTPTRISSRTRFPSSCAGSPIQRSAPWPATPRSAIAST